jgi:hypothetical protein
MMESILAKEEEHANDMLDLLAAHKSYAGFSLRRTPLAAGDQDGTNAERHHQAAADSDENFPPGHKPSLARYPSSGNKLTIK